MAVDDELGAIDADAFNSLDVEAALGSRAASVAFHLTVLAVLAWNLAAFALLAPRMFPNFWYERATVVMGEVTLRSSHVNVIARHTRNPHEGSNCIARTIKARRALSFCHSY